MAQRHTGHQMMSVQAHMAVWRQCVRHWFPRLHHRAYFVPPVYMNRVPYQQVPFANTQVDVPQTPMESPPEGSALELHLSTARDDQTQGRILYCFQVLLERAGRSGCLFRSAIAESDSGSGEAACAPDPKTAGDCDNEESGIPEPGTQEQTAQSESQKPCSQDSKSGISESTAPADAQGEPVVIISQLLFGDYLGNPCYAAAASMLPKPVDLKKQQKHRGDFDLLLIHKHYGLVVCEIKTIGDNFPSSYTEQQKEAKIADRITRGVKQLRKAEEVLTHLVSDQKHPPCVRKALMLPNVTRSQLQRVLANHQNVKQELCKSLDILVSTDPSDLCLTADEVSGRTSPFDITDDVLRRLQVWWRRVVAAPLLSLTDDDYEDLVARFAGPATTVRVFNVSTPPMYLRSQGEGVAETSRRFTRDIVLNPYQVDILNRNEPLVYLCGPPGTGKTVALVVRARDWLCRGWHVHVVSVWEQSLAASYLIAHQLRQVEKQLDEEQQQQQQQSATHSAVAAAAAAGHAHFVSQRVHHHVLDLRAHGNVDAAVECLVASAHSPGPLCLVVDEASKGSPFDEFCAKLSKRVPDLHLWAASLYHGGKPTCLTEIVMIEPLRTPPLVTREVKMSYNIQTLRDVRDYAVVDTPLPTDGPVPIALYHSGPGHNEEGPLHCEMCGHNVAEMLRNLHVGAHGPLLSNITNSATTTTANTAAASTTTTTTTTTIPAPLTYQDVFLLSNLDFDEEERDEAGNVVKPPGGILRGLREAGVPVRLVHKEDSGSVRDVAVMDGPDQVVAAMTETVNGLERAVVVWIQTDRSGNPVGDEMFGRLLVMSRSTSQVVTVVWPPVDESDDGKKAAATCYDPKKTCDEDTGKSEASANP